MMEHLDALAHRKIFGLPVAVIGGILGVGIVALYYWRSRSGAASSAGTVTSTVPNAGVVNATDLAGDGSANGVTTAGTGTASTDSSTNSTDTGTSFQQFESQLTDWMSSLSTGYTSGKSADATTASTANQSNLIYSKAPNNTDIYVTDPNTGISSFVSKSMWDLAGDPKPTSTAAPAPVLVKNSLDNTVYQVHGDGSQTYVSAQQYASMGSPSVQTNNSVVKTPTLVKSANDATIYEVNPITGSKTALTYAQWSAAGKPGFVTV